jgi:dethiobiotin synthetase
MIEAITKIPVIAVVKENDKELNIDINKLLEIYSPNK